MVTWLQDFCIVTEIGCQKLIDTFKKTNNVYVDEITGEKHGVFLQQPSNHLSGGNCPKCTGNYMTQELFLKRERRD